MNDFLDQNNFILTELTSSSMGRIRGELRVENICNVIYTIEKDNTLDIIHIGIDEDRLNTRIKMCKLLIVYILEMHIDRLEKIIISASPTFFDHLLLNTKHCLLCFYQKLGFKIRYKHKKGKTLCIACKLKKNIIIQRITMLF